LECRCHLVTNEWEVNNWNVDVILLQMNEKLTIGMQMSFCYRWMRSEQLECRCHLVTNEKLTIGM
jgi:hypothetical protein